MKRFPLDSYRISSDTRRDPDDTLHAEDGSEALLSVSDMGLAHLLGQVIVRWFHGRNVRRTTYATLDIGTTDPTDFPARFYVLGLIPQLPKAAVWEHTDIRDMRVFVTSFEHPCETPGCPTDWTIEIAAIVTPIDDRLS